MLALAANDGVDRNYFFDLLWPLVAIAAVAIAPVGQATSGPERIAVRAASFAIVAQMVWQMILVGFVSVPTQHQQHAAMGLKARLAAIPAAAGPILAEFPGHAILAGRQPEYLPYMLARMEKAGRFDPAPVVAKLDRRAYAAVILSPRTASGRFSPAIMAAIERNYAVANPTRDLYKDMFCADGPCDLVWLSPNPKK